MTTRRKTQNRTTTRRITASRPADPILGSVGRYVLLSKIASGGQSIVYLGNDSELGRPVAVKVLLDHNPEAEIRIKREARVLAQLKHPGICQIFDIGTAPNHGVYLVLELLEGKTLREVLRELGELAIMRAVAVIHDIAETLRAAHAHGIVHRDLKPENIAILPDGTLKLFDFGIAKATPTSSLTLGVRLGTNGYMSPEQYMAEPIDPSSDIFSLGCIFYELLTGNLPFKTGKDIRTGRYDPLPDSIQREIGTKACDLLTRMLRVESEERPPAGEVADELATLTSRLTKAWQRVVATSVIVRLIEAIPTERESPLAIDEIAQRAAVADDTIAIALVQLPLVFGALHCSVDDASGVLRVRAASEIARYFLKSLVLYIQYGLTLIERWDRREDPRAAEAVPMLGADFVYAMERRRVFQYGLLEPIRIESPVQLIIKGYSRSRRSSVYLMQYDRYAQQYQLIGGRRDAKEPARDAIQRVITKELPHSPLTFGVDYEIHLLRDDVVTSELSRTLGAFTEYRFSIFSARFDNPLVLGEHDRWITEEQLFSGKLEDAAPTPWNYNVARIVGALDRGLAALPFSFSTAID